MDSIKVVVRVRPMGNQIAPDPTNKQSRQPLSSRNLVSVVDDRMLVLAPREEKKANHTFCYDQVFRDAATQVDIFNNTAKPMIESLMQGYNSTIFAYGATGCGKTFTVSGNEQNPGLIPQAVAYLFDIIEAQQLAKTTRLALSYLEIYNEKIVDLLQPQGKPLSLRETKDGIEVSDLSEFYPSCIDQVNELIVKGNGRRTQCPTAANAESSRSHAVLQIKLLQTSTMSGIANEQCKSTLSMIDLAGSERAATTRNKGQQLKEGAHINKSLLALGKCINALSSGSKFIPYRESNLTRLLKFSLGGNCKTLMVACVCPNAVHYDDTLNTLNYANNAKQIRTRTSRNTQTVTSRVTEYVRKIEEQKAVIVQLHDLAEKNNKANELLQVYAQKISAAQSNKDVTMLLQSYKQEKHAVNDHEKVLALIRPSIPDGADDESPAKRARIAMSNYSTPRKVPFTPDRHRVPLSASKPMFRSPILPGADSSFNQSLD